MVHSFCKHGLSLFKHAEKICPRLQRNLSTLHPSVQVGEHVAQAISNKQPTVALESTIFTHGLPYPDNLNVALNVECIIRENGAVPATIGISAGKLIVGMSEEEIVELVHQKEVVKTSRRDLSYVLSKKMSGGTTVAGTMVAAHMVGVDVFVTGGIGGVHRGATQSFDISADLMELSRTPVAVICSGVKSILDIGLTLEYLETQGVPVITHGPSQHFPAFFTPKSKFKAPYHLECVHDIANLIYQQHLLKLSTGIVVGVPIPTDRSTDHSKIECDIERALEEAKTQGIVGKEITPFVLGKIRELTEGDSLQSNIKLVENNAKVGAQISVELSKLKCNGDGGARRDRIRVCSNIDTHCTDNTMKRPVVIGGSIFDIKATVNSVSTVAEDTNLGKLHTSFGGVGRNIAECLGRLGTNPLLVSSVGNDHQGEMLLNNLQQLGIDTAGVAVSDTVSTASYSVVANNMSGELMMAVGDMDNHDEITPQRIYEFKESIKNATIVVLDGNLSECALDTALTLCSDYNVPTWFDPTTVSRSARPFNWCAKKKPITYCSPNFEELKAINEFLGVQSPKSGSEHSIDSCLELCKGCLDVVDNLTITLGKNGILLVCKHPRPFIFSPLSINDSNNPPKTTVLHYPSASERHLPVRVKSVSGAGDSFAAGVLYGYLNGYDTDTCVKGGLLAAYTSLHTYVAISDHISPQLLTYENIHTWADFDAKVL